MRCVVSTDLLRAQLLLPSTLRACCPTISLYSIALLIRKLRMWHHPPRSHLYPSSSLGPLHTSQMLRNYGIPKWKKEGRPSPLV